jgi:hypothetical protein
MLKWTCCEFYSATRPLLNASQQVEDPRGVDYAPTGDVPAKSECAASLPHTPWRAAVSRCEGASDLASL